MERSVSKLKVGEYVWTYYYAKPYKAEVIEIEGNDARIRFIDDRGDIHKLWKAIDNMEKVAGEERPKGEILKFEVEIDRGDLDVIKHTLLLGSVKDATDELVLHNRIACWRGKGGSAIVLKSVKVRIRR